MDQLLKLAEQHFLAVPVVVAFFTALGARIDDVILFALRFFDAATIEAELDRLEALAKARVEANAAKLKATAAPLPGGAPNAPQAPAPAPAAAAPDQAPPPAP